MRATQNLIQNVDKDTLNNPALRYRVHYQAVSANRPGTADEVIQFLRDEASATQIDTKSVVIKESEKKKYKPKQIVELMNNSGYPRFNMHQFIELWQLMDAKNPNRGFGTILEDGQWYWYESWLKEVRNHCELSGDTYKA